MYNIKNQFIFQNPYKTNRNTDYFQFGKARSSPQDTTIQPKSSFIKKNYKKFLGVIVIIIIAYFLFKKATSNIITVINTNVSSLKELQSLYYIKPISDNSNYVDPELGYTLCDFYILSSYRSYLSKSYNPTYSTLMSIEYAIRAGARYIELDIYNANFNKNTFPIVCLGSELGNYHYTTGVYMPGEQVPNIKATENCDTNPKKACKGPPITFEACIQLIDNLVFNKSELTNSSDPFILGLNLKIDGNYNTAQKIASILNNTQNLNNSQRRLSQEYNYTKKNLANVPMSTLVGIQKESKSDKDNLAKFVVISSGGFQHSEELSSWVNGLWLDEDLDKPYISLCADNKQKIPSRTPKQVADFHKEEFDNSMFRSYNFEELLNESQTQIIKFNRNGLTRVYPKDLNTKQKPDYSVFDSSYTNNRLASKNVYKSYVSSSKGSVNYDSYVPWRLGCQFICMNLSPVDDKLELYLDIFRDREKKSPSNKGKNANISKPSIMSFALKPTQLRAALVTVPAAEAPDCKLGYNPDMFTPMKF